MKNSTVKLLGETLSENWPKCVYNSASEEATYVLRSGDSLPAVGTPNLVIIDPHFPGWGTDFHNLYIKDGKYNGVISLKVAGSSTPVNPPIEIPGEQLPQDELILNMTVWNTSSGKTSDAQKSFNGLVSGGLVPEAYYGLEIAMEYTSINIPLVVKDGVKRLPFSSISRQYSPSVELPLGYIFLPASGKCVNKTTGVITNLLKGKPGDNQTSWDDYSSVGKKSIQLPGVVVLNTKIVGVVRERLKSWDFDSEYSWSDQYSYEFYVWDRNGNYISSAPLPGYAEPYSTNGDYNYLSVSVIVPVSENDFFVSDNNATRYYNGGLYKINLDGFSINAFKMPSDASGDAGIFGKAFLNEGLDYVTSVHSVKDSSGNAYIINGGAVEIPYGAS